MFYFRIQATPKLDSVHADDDIGGAYVSVWINFPHDKGAEILARHYIEDAGWNPGPTLESCSASEDDYSADDDRRKYIQEAIETGGSLVFHNWPSDADDAEVEYEIN